MKHHRRTKPVIKDLFEDRKISITGFAGCGGADLGVKAATGHEPAIAINHDPVAIAVFADNFESTECYRADVFELDMLRACRGRQVRHLHVSPDCRDHSRAKGGKPVSESVRALADVVPKWVRVVRPEVITLENVPEFLDWGPLGRDGKRIAARKGEFFRRWVGDLQTLGYVVEWRVLAAHHYGAHTSRRRLYLVARCDGQPIVWPKPTHGPGLKKYRTAAECIDWSLLARSIFNRAKPLAAATLRRIAAGIVKFCLGKDPYVITLRRNGRAAGLDEPLTTVTAGGTHHGLVVPTLVQVSYGERKGQAPRVLDLQKPLGTVVAGGVKHGLVETTVAPFVGTIDNASSRGTPQGIDEPLSTIIASNQRHTFVETQLAAFISQYNLGQVGHELTKPLPTITAIDHHAVVEVTTAPPEFFEQYPNARHVYPFLISYYGSEADIGQALGEPLRTITTRDRFGLVTLVLDREGRALVDIGLRMLEPHELLKAQFGKHAKRFRLDKALTKKDQVRLIGNSVVPAVMEAIVRANLGETKPTRRAA